MPLSQTQVLIVGAGPTGLSLAAQLQRYGVGFVMADKKEGVTLLSKAMVVQARSLEIFREIGLSDRAVSHGKITMALNMYHNGKRRAHLDLSQMGKGLSAFPYALSLEQSKTEKLLAGHLKSQGVDIEWQTELENCCENGAGVIATLRHSSGKMQKIRADYLVGCDGASSTVRHMAGMGFSGDTVPRIFYVADVTVCSTALSTSEMSIFLLPKGFVLFFPMEGDGHFRMIGILPDAAEAEAENLTFDDVKRSLEGKLKIDLKYEAVHWFSHYKVHSRKADAFSKGRIFLAGDAAHIHTPAGGQGMNTGIQDAYNLAWKLAFVLNGTAASSLLDSYSVEREANARKLLRTTDAAFEYMAGTTWFSNFIRLHIFPYVAHLLEESRLANRFVFPLISEIGIAYPHSPLTVKSRMGKVCAGDRMPYFLLPDDRDVFEIISAPGFKLLYFGKEVLPDAPLPIISLTDIPERWFGNAREFYILLRPDNHISYIGHDGNAVAQFLQQLKKQT